MQEKCIFIVENKNKKKLEDRKMRKIDKEKTAKLASHREGNSCGLWWENNPKWISLKGYKYYVKGLSKQIKTRKKVSEALTLKLNILRYDKIMDEYHKYNYKDNNWELQK